MHSDPLSMDEPVQTGGRRRLSQNGQMAAIGVYGFLVTVGFFFGIVTGYERAKPPKDKEQAKAETPKPNPTPGPPPKVTTPTPKVTPEPAKPEPKEEPKPEPKKIEPKPEPKPEIKKEEPKKVEPKPDPKKDETATSLVSFEKDVKPILRTYCFNCHGAAGKPKGDVDLTSLAKIIDPKNPPILKAGNAKGSAIFTTIDDQSMPPNGSRPSKGELEVIKNWIAGGAKPRRRRLR